MAEQGGSAPLLVSPISRPKLRAVEEALNCFLAQELDGDFEYYFDDSAVDVVASAMLERANKGCNVCGAVGLVGRHTAQRLAGLEPEGGRRVSSAVRNAPGARSMR